jgi:hypothetical protein
MELAINSKPLQHVSVNIISIEVWAMKNVFYQFDRRTCEARFVRLQLAMRSP